VDLRHLGETSEIQRVDRTEDFREDAMTKGAKGGKRPLELDKARLVRELQGLRRLRAEAAALARSTGYASDELIADRRAEAVKDAEETLRWLHERTGML
jgi:hypothetical protein